MSTPVQQEEQRKRIAYVAFGVVMLGMGYYIYTSFFATTAPPAPPTTAPVAVARNTGEGKSQSAPASAAGQGSGLGVAPGVAATKMASTSSSLDPTLDESAMLRTESLVYSGTGRNIFSLTYTAPVAIPVKAPPARPGPVVAPPPPAQVGPPPPPPINLKYFGTEVRSDGKRQAFLLSGEDVYLASEGDVVARKYKILTIGPSNIKVEDLTNANMQTLPLQAN